MVPYKLINNNAPLSEAFIYVGLGWAAKAVAIGSITTLTSTTLTSLMGQPRIFYQMAQDGLLFKIFAKVSSRQIPVFGTIITGVLAALLAFLFNLDILTVCHDSEIKIDHPRI